MRTIVVDTLSELAALDKACNRLIENTPGALPMQGTAWISSYLECRLAASDTWFGVFVFDKDEMVGALVTVVRSTPTWPRRPTLITPQDHHILGASFLIAPGHEETATAAIMRACTRHMQGWQYLQLNRVVRSTELAKALDSLNGRFPISKKPRGRGAYLPTVGDYAAYRASLSRNFRNNINKANNKLASLQDVRYAFLSGADAHPRHLAPWMVVEASGWKGREGTAVSQNTQRRRFYETLVQRLWTAGWLEWHQLEADGRLIAGNLAIRLGRSIFVWKLGYDEAYRHCSPGTLLFSELVKRSYEDADIDEINLLTDHPWYCDWKMQYRLFDDVRLHRWQLAPLIFSYLPMQSRGMIRKFPRLAAAIRRCLDR